jgi:predicted nucleic acid-binding protein
VKTLIDTNIAVLSVNERDPARQMILAYLDQLLVGGDELCIAPQVLYEFWVVATRPIELNGLGLEPKDAKRKIGDFLVCYSSLVDPVELVDQWLKICADRSIRGRQAHDARLVASMLLHGVKKLVTLNASDFRRFPEIECLVPN